MEVMEGSCRFGLWFVHIRWSGNQVHQVRFSKVPLPGPVPVPLRKFLSGRARDLNPLVSIAIMDGSPYALIYRIVQRIPYGASVTYGEIARECSSTPRAVGQAMKRNPTPLLIPCHRVVAKSGPGGFTPAIEIKIALQALERKGTP
jgi:methylated-DNA-[protein]-cysteine S-methyltransferase